jgi:phage gpG-like protein
VADKDDCRVQRERIERIVRELCPGCKVEYDPERTPDWIKFRIVHETTGTILAVSSGDWHSSEIADKTDDWLRAFVKQIGGGRI